MLADVVVGLLLLQLLATAVSVPLALEVVEKDIVAVAAVDYTNNLANLCDSGDLASRCVISVPKTLDLTSVQISSAGLGASGMKIYSFQRDLECSCVDQGCTCNVEFRDYFPHERTSLRSALLSINVQYTDYEDSNKFVESIKIDNFELGAFCDPTIPDDSFDHCNYFHRSRNSFSF